MKKILTIILFFFGFNTLSATDIMVRIYSDQNIRKAELTCVLGDYHIADEDGKEIILLKKDDSITLHAERGRVKLLKDRQEIGVFDKITVMGEGLKAMFKISPDNKNIRNRIYDDHLEISLKDNALCLVNIVNIENYVAGVIQSEVLGSSDDVEFFKIQAIISRTYAMTNIRKHRQEGFNLCDGVHCQAYYSRNNTPKILQAVMETSGMVLVDENRKTILASFHANSGGQTMNSEDVWATKVPYLRRVEDPASCSMKGGTWQKEYTTKEWLSLLHKHFKYDIHDSVKRSNALTFSQKERKAYFHENIRLTDMRRALGLRSTWFSVRLDADGDRIILDGKGYGHGVGLSQEGAIQMIKEGHTVEDILKFYYNNVGLVKIDDLFEGEELQF